MSKRSLLVCDRRHPQQGVVLAADHLVLRSLTIGTRQYDVCAECLTAITDFFKTFIERDEIRTVDKRVMPKDKVVVGSTLNGAKDRVLAYLKQHGRARHRDLMSASGVGSRATLDRAIRLLISEQAMHRAQHGEYIMGARPDAKAPIANTRPRPDTAVAHIIKVLKDSNEPLKVSEILGRLPAGLIKATDATPERKAVQNYLWTHARHIFRNMGPGLWTVRKAIREGRTDESD